MQMRSKFLTFIANFIKCKGFQDKSDFQTLKPEILLFRLCKALTSTQNQTNQ